MRTLITILTMGFFMSLGAQVNENKEVSKIAKEKYLLALQHENHGVISSAMNNIIHLRLVYRDLEMTEIENTLSELERTAPTKMLSYKAYITKNFIRSPDHFNWLTENMVVLEKIDQRLDNQIKAVANAKDSKDSLLVARKYK